MENPNVLNIINYLNRLDGINPLEYNNELKNIIPKIIHYTGVVKQKYEPLPEKEKD